MKMKIYWDLRSGNCLKVKLILDLLQKPYQGNNIDLLKGESQLDTYLAINPNGKLPFLITDEGQKLAESNAILFYLAQDSQFLPDGHWVQSQILQWMFFEQYNHGPNLATARLIRKFLGITQENKQIYTEKLASGRQALAVMETKLTEDDFFVGPKPTIADIALFPTTFWAADAGIELQEYPVISAWLSRMQNLPYFPNIQLH